MPVLKTACVEKGLATHMETTLKKAILSSVMYFVYRVSCNSLTYLEVLGTGIVVTHGSLNYYYLIPWK